MQSYKNLVAVFGLSLCGISLYLIHRYWKKDEEDTLIRTSNFTTVEFPIPGHLVKDVIGYKGSNIKKIENSTGTRIFIRDNENKRVCIIKGTSEACQTARLLIKEFIENLPKIEEEVLYVPRGVAPKMIGRGGENINVIQNMSGAKINISKESGDASSLKVTFKGTKIQIAEAKSLFQQRLQEFVDFDTKLQSELSKREPRAPPKSASNDDNEDNLERVTARRESLSQMFDSSDSPFDVYVSALMNPSKFWIQIVGPKAAELDRLVEEMTEFYSNDDNREAYKMNSIKEGDLVAASFKYDNKWYRAEILSVDEEKSEAILHYVDYGDKDITPLQNIVELRTDFLRLHFQAIECYLYNIVAANDEWSEEAVDKFEEWTYVAQWKTLSAKIRDYTKKEDRREGSPVPGIDLYDLKNGERVSITEKLVNGNFGYYKRLSSPKLNEATGSNVNV